MNKEWQYDSRGKSDTAERIATGLGWFSIGLGLAEVLAPGGVASLIGMRDSDSTRSLLRFYGLREIAAGIGILSSSEKPAGWVWARVAGDAMDLATLGSGFGSDNNDDTKLTTATAAVLGVAALDVWCARELGKSTGQVAATPKSTAHVSKSIVINRSVEEVYRFWHDFRNLPRFMKYLDSVEITGDKQSHWKAKGPAGMTVEWDAQTVDDQPDSFISWRSLDSSDIYNSGIVRFERATGGRGTFVRVEMDYAPPGGVISAKLFRLFGTDATVRVAEDLRAFKQIMETGEIPKSDASIHDGMHAAQPAAN